MSKPVRVVLEVKDPDAFYDLCEQFEDFDDEFLEFGEYASLELTVSEDGTFTGRFL